MTTTKTISLPGYVGYSLSATYGALTVTSSGAIGGVQGTDNPSGSLGGPGGAALTVANYEAAVSNDGTIIGGGGGLCEIGGEGGVGGAGGSGVLVTAKYVTVNNEALIRGGAGGYSGGAGGMGGDGGAGVSLTQEGRVTNSGRIFGGAPGTPPSGAVEGDGVALGAGGNLYNYNGGTITGSIGVAGGSGGASRVSNKGTVSGQTTGVSFAAANNTLYNSATGSIFGEDAAVEATASAAVTNLGSMTTNGQTGVTFAAGGSLTNGSSSDSTALISGYFALSATGGAVSVTNHGYLDGDVGPGSGTAVNVRAGGTILNEAGGNIDGGRTGVYAGGAATVINFGAIEGETYAVRFNSLSGRMIIEAGSSAIGMIYGAFGTLEIAGGTGTLDGLGNPYGAFLSGGAGAEVEHFNSYVFDAGASWDLSSGTLDTMRTLVDDGTVTVTGYMQNNGTVLGGAGAAGGYQAAGGTGVDALKGGGGASLDNTGLVRGGVGGDAGASGYLIGYMGGTGGAGLDLAAGSSIANHGMIFGGQGGTGGPATLGGVGGTGGTGVVASTITNFALIEGGEGGTGGDGSGTAGPGGQGGTGVVVLAGGHLVNMGQIKGGYGGSASSVGSYSPGGSEGYGVTVQSGGYFRNGGYGMNATTQGGIGVEAGAGATIVNDSTIVGEFERSSFISVALTSSDDLLEVGIGAQFVGSIVGGGGTLELNGGIGYVSGLGYGGTMTGSATATFGGFGTYETGASSYWKVLGYNRFKTGQTLINGGTLQVTGGADLTLHNGITNSNLGSIQIDGAMTVESSTLQQGSGATLTVGTGGAGLVTLDAGRILGGTVVIASGSQLDTQSHASDIKIGVSVINEGLIEIKNGANLQLGGTTDNTGQIVVAGSSVETGLIADALGLTLTGDGSVSLSALGYIGGASLDNASDTITGGGLIRSGVTLTNGALGVIDAQSLMRLETADTLTNDGLIESTGSGLLVVKAATTLDSSGGGSVVDGHKLLLEDATLNGGSLTIDSGAILASEAGGGTIDLGSGTVANAGVMEAVNGNLWIEGAVSGTGVAKLYNGASLELDGAFSQKVVFAAGSTGTLTVGALFTGTVVGLTASNHLDLRSVAFDPTDVVTFAPNVRNPTANGVLYVYQGTTVLASVKLAGDYVGSTWNFVSDGAGGTLITDPPSAAPLASAMAAFAPGAATIASTASQSPPPPTLSRPG